jgi:hypothetical protein
LAAGEARAVVNGIVDGNESRSLLTGAE